MDDLGPHCPFGPQAWREILEIHARYARGGCGRLDIEIDYDDQGRPVKVHVSGRVFRQLGPVLDSRQCRA